MEAIESSSSSSNYHERPLSVAEYEDIEYIRTHSNEAYVSHQPPQSGPVYDEPNTTTKRPLSPGAPLLQQKNEGFPPGDLASYYDEPSEITSKPSAQTKTPLSPMHNMITSKSIQQNVDSSDNCYVDMIKSESDDHSDTLPPPLQLQKSQSIPRRLETLSDISLENLSNLNSNDIQLLMLLQMQKVVQDTAEVTRNLGRSRVDGFEQPQACPPCPPPFLPPLEEIEEIYDEDEGDDYYNQPSADTLSKSRPQSCRVKKSYPEETSTTSGVGFQELRHRANTTVIATGIVAPHSHLKSTHQHVIPSAHPPPLKPKPDTLGTGLPYNNIITGSHHNNVIIMHAIIIATKKVRSMIPATVRQKREAAHEEMISKGLQNVILSSLLRRHNCIHIIINFAKPFNVGTLKRRNKSLSPNIASL